MGKHPVYSWLVKLYPATFRERHQDAIEQQFHDEHREAGTRSERALVWLRAIADVAASAPREVAREVSQDLKYAARNYGKHPVSGVLAVAALGLAMGASTAVFSVLNALLLRGLPFRSPEQLVGLQSAPVSVPSGRVAVHDWIRRSAYLQDAGMFSVSEMNLGTQRGAARVKTAETSANLLHLLGMSPVVGRTFTADEEMPGRTGVAVISHSLWQQFFGGDPGVSGKSVELNGRPFTIIGVAPPRFDFPGKRAIWTPSVFDSERIPKRGAVVYETIGRLKPGLRMQEAQALFREEVKRVAPERLRGDEFNRARLISISDQLAGPVGKASWVLAGMMLLVLVAASANVAHLLLSRLATRRQEFALRTALGASQARIVQQLMTEAMALTMVGAAGGLVIAYWVSRLIASAAPPQLASQQYTVLDWRVMAFAAAVAALMGLTFGVLPSSLLKESFGARAGGYAILRDHRTRRTRFLLLSVQACLTLALLASSMTMGRTFLRLLDVDLGFRPSSTVTMTVSLQGTNHRTTVAERRYYAEALEKLRSLPEVEAAGAVSYVPLQDQFYMAGAFTLDSGQSVKQVIINAATRDYFRAMSTRFLAGRDFPALASPAEKAVIVNEAFAQATGLGRAVVGRRVVSPWGGAQYEVLGVVETSRFGGPSSGGPPMVYWAIEEEPGPNVTLVARVNGDAQAHVARCRDVVRSLDPNVPIYDVLTLDERLAKVLARPRFYVTAILVLASVALVLAIAGTFGTAAHAVSQRTREFGIRMALGASALRLRAHLMTEALLPTALGGAAGIALAAAQSRYFGYLLTDVDAIRLWNCAMAALVLVGAAATATWMATARLAALDPSTVIRQQMG